MCSATSATTRSVKPLVKPVFVEGGSRAQASGPGMFYPTAKRDTVVKEGDVIVAIANAEVNSVKEFDAAVAKMDKNKPINLLLRRGEWAQYALIRPVK